MSRYLTPAGIVEARPMVQKSTGQQFIRDPEGRLWRLADCKPIPERDPEDPLARTITEEEWRLLKESGAILGLNPSEIRSIVQEVTGQTRGSFITLRQMEVIFERMEHWMLRHIGGSLA